VLLHDRPGRHLGGAPAVTALLPRRLLDVLVLPLLLCADPCPDDGISDGFVPRFSPQARTSDTPTLRAQWAQQNIRPSSVSTPWPMIRHPQ